MNEIIKFDFFLWVCICVIEMRSYTVEKEMGEYKLWGLHHSILTVNDNNRKGVSLRARL